MREIIFDTETTGFDPSDGHRICEIGCIEMVDGFLTDNEFHAYLNPGRDMPPEAEAVHGLSDAFLADKPMFGEIATALVAFIGDSKLVAHNAEFDRRFLNWELRNVGEDQIPQERTIDTLAISRKKFPGAKHTLDALCNRFGIDLSGREKHGALLDAQLLAHVYIELNGGRQIGLQLAPENSVLEMASTTPHLGIEEAPAKIWPARPHAPAAGEARRHADFVATLGDAIWAKYKDYAR